MPQPSILIVGAGPVGLTLANLLTHYGIDYHIIDKHPGISVYSKALAMHARTLELCDQLNLSQEFMEAGRVLTEANIYADVKRIAHVDLNTIPSKYNLVLSIEQSQSERILETNLIKQGKQVHWNNELIEIKINDTNNHVKIRDENQTIQEMQFDYVCSCEGAHSTVRKQAQSSFHGASYDQAFLLADVLAQTDLKPNSVYGFLSKNKIFATIPLKKDRYWRIITTVDNDYPANLTNPSIDDVYELTQNSIPENFKIKQATWISHFHVHHRIVNQYRKANVFLVGDAAHIHSPIGGQGMNAGMHDAFNLAEKLAAVINDKANPNILDLYDKERRKVGQKIVNGTDLATRIITGRNYWTHTLQKLLVPWFFSKRSIRNRLVKNLAMLD